MQSRSSFVVIWVRFFFLAAAAWSQVTTANVSAFSLEGKQVLVTGSSGGIGKGIALELARRGAKVIVHYHTRKEQAYELQRTLGDSCLGVVFCDFRVSTEIPSFVSNVLDLCGEQGLDVLINNAGVVNVRAMEDDDDELNLWHETMAINLHAPYQISKLALPTLKKASEGGVIINISSIHGEKSNEYMGAYAASKAALNSITRTMAVEFASHNVRVNALSPGVVPVERSQQAFADPVMREAWEERLPLQRCGLIEEIAQACMPLIENDWITGSVWQIDGGMMARANMPNRSRPPKPDPTC